MVKIIKGNDFGLFFSVKECKKYLQESADIADHEEQEAGKELVPINSKRESSGLGFSA